MQEIKKILLVCPHYNEKSNGILVYYSLSDHFTKLGFNVQHYPVDKNVFESDKKKYPLWYLNKFIENIDLFCNKTLCILPDSIPFELSKQLKFKWRLWYLLNKPSFLTNEPLHYMENDIFVSYSNLVAKDEYQLFLNNKIPELNNIIEIINKNQIQKKNQIAIYWGKSRCRGIKLLIILKLLSFGFFKIVPINRNHPSDKKKLYQLLSESKLLVSFDPFTNLVYESNLCRTPCVIADNYMGINYKDYNIDLLGISDKLPHIFSMYRDGINQKNWEKMCHQYYITSKNHLEAVQSLVKFIYQEINLISSLSQAQKQRRIAAIINQHSFQYQLYKNQLRKVDTRIQNFSPVMSLKIYLKLLINRKLQLFFNIISKILLVDTGFVFQFNNLFDSESGNIRKKYFQSVFGRE